MHKYTSLGAMMLQIDIELVECVFCEYTIVVVETIFAQGQELQL